MVPYGIIWSDGRPDTQYDTVRFETYALNMCVSIRQYVRIGAAKTQTHCSPLDNPKRNAPDKLSKSKLVWSLFRNFNRGFCRFADRTIRELHKLSLEQLDCKQCGIVHPTIA